MFINKEMELSILQISETQVRAYNHFLSLLGNKRLALKHTKIFMDSFMLFQKKEGEI